MELNFIAFAYLFLRLAPFILICFFTLSSIFNQDFKGIIYLLGVLTSSILCLSASPLISYLGNSNDTSITTPNICKSLTINKVGVFSNIPLGQNVIVFTMFYLIYSMMTYNIVTQNWVTIVFFTLLTIFNFYWNISHECHTVTQMTAATVLGSFGMFWGYLIDKGFNSKRLLYFAGLEQSNHCSRPSRQTFKCRVYKNGNLISG